MFFLFFFSMTTAGTPEIISPTGALAELARFVLRHRRLVVLLWVILLVAGAAAAGQVSKRLTFDFPIPGQAGYTTAQKIEAIYGNGGAAAPSLLVVTVPSGQSFGADQAKLAAAFARLRVEEPKLRIVDYASTHNRVFLTSDGRTTFAYAFAPRQRGFGARGYSKIAGKQLSELLPGYKVDFTGLAELEQGSSSRGIGILAETVLTGVGALAVLAFVFASFLAVIPIIIAIFSILTTFLLILGFSYIADVSAIVQFLVALVGLGVAIDYSLLIVTRWREERAKLLDNADAVVAAIATAGRSVLLSGLTVGIGLLALVVLPEPAMRSIGIGGMLIPLISVAAALTLLPVFLVGFGRRIDWPRLRKEAHASHGWSAWARGVVHRRWIAAIVATAVLAVMVVPVFGLTTGQTGANALANKGSAHNAYGSLVAGGVPAGVLTPLEVLASRREAAATQHQLTAISGIAEAVVSRAPDSNRAGTTVVIGIPRVATVNSKTLAPVREATAAFRSRPGVVGVAGEGALTVAYQNAIFGNFPLMFAVIGLLTFILLARAFRSILLALKALLMNMLSLAATFGMITWFWQEGHGSQALFGVAATGALTFWLPLLIFAFLYGLSMDYEVFILTRIREEYERTGSTNEAIILGLGRTGRLVSSAALILFLSFVSLTATPNTDIKVLATGLGAGILLDATVIRGLLVPALIALFGRFNWWMPTFAARVLRIEPMPLHSRSVGAPATEEAS